MFPVGFIVYILNLLQSTFKWYYTTSCITEDFTTTSFYFSLPELCLLLPYVLCHMCYKLHTTMCDYFSLHSKLCIKETETIKESYVFSHVIPFLMFFIPSCRSVLPSGIYCRLPEGLALMY